MLYTSNSISAGAQCSLNRLAGFQRFTCKESGFGMGWERDGWGEDGRNRKEGMECSVLLGNPMCVLDCLAFSTILWFRRFN